MAQEIQNGQYQLKISDFNIGKQCLLAGIPCYSTSSEMCSPVHLKIVGTGIFTKQQHEQSFYLDNMIDIPNLLIKWCVLVAVKQNGETQILQPPSFNRQDLNIDDEDLLKQVIKDFEENDIEVELTKSMGIQQITNYRCI